MATSLSVTLHTKLKVYVTVVTPEGLFYIQLDSPDAYSLPSLSEQLSQLVLNNPGKNRGFSPSPGTKCCAQSLNDNCWYRGLILSVDSSMFTVYFVDYGNTESNVPISRLFPAISKYFEMPFQAIKCKLANFAPNNDTWSQDIVSALSDNILNQEVPALFYGVLPDANGIHDIPCYLTTLYWEESDDTYTVSDELVSMGMGTYPKETPEQIMSVPKSKPTPEMTTSIVTNEYTYRTMEVGQQYKLYVSYAESPDVVWGQLSDHTHELDSIVLQLHEQFSFNGFTQILEDSSLVDPLLPGKPCCVLYTVDGNWCRGLIEEVDDETLKTRVLFIDYGNIDTFDVSDLYSLPSQFFDVPVQAISFSLHNIIPLDNNEWSHDAVVMFEQLYDNQELIADVMCLDEDGYPSVRLFHPIKNSYINELLIQEGYAVAITNNNVGASATPSSIITSNKTTPYVTPTITPQQITTPNITPKLTTPNITPKMATPITTPIITPKVVTPAVSNTSSPKKVGKSVVPQYTEPPVPIGKNMLVYVTVIESLDKFYCQLYDPSEELGKLTNLITCHCNSNEVKPLPVALPNLPVLAKFVQDENWYRGRLSPPKEGSSQWSVFFVDFGNSELVNLNTLVSLPEPYLRLPAQCFQCTLEGISPSLLKDQESIDEFSNLVLDQDIQCIATTVTKRDNNKEVIYTVRLSREGVDVAAILNSKSPSESTANKVSKSYSDVTKSPTRSLVKSPVKASSNSAMIPNLSLSIDRTIQVVVCFVESPLKFSCQLSDNSNAIEYLVSQMSMYYNRPETPPTPVKPVKGTCCAGLFAQDSQWYRGLIIEVHNQNEISVLFVDYGNVEVISLQDTRKLTPEFMSLPNQAVTCLLDGFSSSLISDDISFKFESMCLDNTYQCKFTSSDAGINIDPIPCQLIDMSSGESILNSLLPKTTPTNNKTTPIDNKVTPTDNLKSNVRDFSPTLSNSSREFERNKSNFSSQPSDERPSRSKDRYEKTGPPVTRRSNERSSSRSHREASNDSTRRVSNDTGFKKSGSRDTSRSGGRGDNLSSRDSSRPLTSSDKIEPFVPFGNSPMIGWVSHIESPSRFYVQPSITSGKFERLTSSLNHYYLEERKGETLKTPLVNSYVCVLLEDGAYYRCKIQEINNDEILVFSIDYGSTHVVNINRVYLLSSKFFSLPGQAVCFKWTKYCSSDRTSPDEMKLITENMVHAIMDQEVELSFVNNRYDNGYEVDVNIIVKRNLSEVLISKTTSQTDEIIQSDLPVTNNTLAQQKEEGQVVTDPPFIFLESGRNIEGVISAITPSGHIYIHLSTSENILDKIMSCIANFMTNPLQEITLSSPILKHGSFILGQFTVDNNWYRAMILDLIGDQVNVLYIDFGNREVLPLTRLHPISPSLLKYPRQVIECSLQRLDLYTPSTGAIEVIENEVAEMTCIIDVNDSDRSNGVHVISSLILKEDSRNVCQWIIDNGLFVKQVTADHTSSTNEECIDHTQVPIDHTQISIDRTPSIQSLKNYPIIKGETISVYFSHQEDDKTVWVTSTVQSVELEALSELLNESYTINTTASSENEIISNPQTGQFCCVKSINDGRWYRALITGPIKFNKIPVLYVDYGNREVVSSVYVLKSEFTSLPVSAIKCQLNTVVSEHQWEEPITLHFTGEELTSPSVWHVCVSRPSLAIVPPSPFRRPHSPIKDITIPLLQIKSGDKYEVYISHTESPNHFYCQLVQESELLEDLMAQIADYYTDKLIELEDLKVGTYCVAQYSSNNSWYRAIVCEILEEDKVQVSFIDYGNSEIISTSSVQGIHNNFTHLTAQAFPCSLLSSTSGHFSEDQLEAFFSLNIDEESFQVLVKSQLSSGEWFVELFDKHGECPHELFVSPVISPLTTDVQSTVISLYSIPNYPPGSTVDVFVTCVNGPNDFYCQPLELASQLDELMTDISTFMSSQTFPSPLTLSSVTIGQPCLARYTDNSEWYRGKIDTLHEDTQKVLVRYVDYGNLALLNLESITTLPSQFLSVPTQALHCSVLKSNSTVIAPNLSEKFIRTFSEEEQYTLSILSLDDSKYHVEVSNGNGSMSFSFLYNEMTSPTLTTTSGDIKELETDESLFHSSSLVPKNSKSPPTDLEESEEDSNATGEPLIHAPCKLSLLANEVLYVTVVYVKDPSLLYLQRVDCSSELESLASEISQYCTDCADQLYQQSYQTGDFVLAQSEEVWYRACVTDALPGEDGFFEVQFIDYGNYEIVSSKNMIMCPANFLELPVQAIPCSLSQVPSRDGWPDSYTQLIIDLTSDRALQANVVVAGKQSIPAIINLQDLENEIDISTKVLESLEEECEAGSAMNSIIGKEIEKVEEKRDDSLESSLKDGTSIISEGSTSIISEGGSEDLNAKIEFLREKLELVCNIKSNKEDRIAGEPSLLIEDSLLEDESKNESSLMLKDILPLKEESDIEEGSMILDDSLITNDKEQDSQEDATTTNNTLEESVMTNDSIESFAEGPTENPTEELTESLTKVSIENPIDNVSIEKPMKTNNTEIPTEDSISNKEPVIPIVDSHHTEETKLVEDIVNVSTCTTSSTLEGSVLEEVEVDDTITERDILSSNDSAKLIPTLQRGSQYKVLVVNITSPCDIVCHLASYSQVLDVVMTLLAQTYESSGTDYVLTTPPGFGDIICAKYTNDDKYYRAKVLEIIVEEEQATCYTVEYIDYGNQETVTLDRLFKLDPKVSVNMYPSFGIHCTLHGLPDSFTGYSDQINDSLVNTMYEMIYESEPVMMEVTNRVKNQYQVKLMNWNNTECINDRIIDMITHQEGIVNTDSSTSDQLTVSISLDQIQSITTSH